MAKISIFALLLPILCLLTSESVENSIAQPVHCLASDREALIEFKNGLNDTENQLSSWRGSNCCQWLGIECENSTGAVSAVRYGSLGLSGEIRPSLAKLKSLSHLDLSGNDFYGISIPEFFGSLENLQFLNLSYAGFSGKIPLNLRNLSRLQFLDLSENKFQSEIPDWLANISSLQHIDMSYSGLYGRIPLGLAELPNLLSLDLSSNQNLTANCSQLFDGRWEKIQELDFFQNKLYGKLPSSLGNMTSLVYLDLENNEVEGGIPGSIGRLCNLQSAYLTFNKLGSLPEFLEGAENCGFGNPLPSLEYLFLSFNQVAGKIPEWFGQLSNLAQLLLEGNMLEGSIPYSLGSSRNLTILIVGGNKLSGTLPLSLGQLSELSWLHVSSNNLTGFVSEAHLAKLTKLTYLDLSENSLALNVSSNWIPSFKISTLKMGSCVLGPSFPLWLRTQNAFRYLDLSNASLSGPVPSWFWDISSNLEILNMSHNQLGGQLTSLSNISSTGATIDLSFNLFEGPVPLIKSGIKWPYLSFISLSNNNVSGKIPMSIGELSYLEFIDFSDNNLTGSIPSSLSNCSRLKILNLQNNNLDGMIPDSFGQLQELQSLHLTHNWFLGKLPSSLRNLSNLRILDLGNNGFLGIIPPWFGDSYENLTILSLRSNAFSGILPPELSKLTSLQVLDLAGNALNGSIPAKLGDLKAMAEERKINRGILDISSFYYRESLVVNMKGQYLTYTTTLSLVTSIDLSGNNLSGNLPHEITRLSGLVIFNLSRNHITGKIPGNISNMHQLLSLDLSSNQLSGAIPPSMSALSFLEFLNLSNNNLLGAIPYTGQMTTFDEPSFAGNPGLCGLPLNFTCPGDDSDQGSDNGNAENDGFIDNWFYMSIGLGFAAGILVPFLILAMKKSWSDAYFRFVDKVIEKLSWLIDRRGYLIVIGRRS